DPRCTCRDVTPTRYVRPSRSEHGMMPNDRNEDHRGMYSLECCAGKGRKCSITCLHAAVRLVVSIRAITIVAVMLTAVPARAKKPKGGVALTATAIVTAKIPQKDAFTTLANILRMSTDFHARFV